MIKQANVSCNQVRNRELIFLQVSVVAKLTKLCTRHLLVRKTMILHLRHLKSRVVTSHLHKDHFIEDEIANNSSTWINRHSFLQEEVLLLLIVEVLEVAIHTSQFERFNARGRETTRIVLRETVISLLEQVVISIGVGIFCNIQVSDWLSQLLVRADLNFVGHSFLL